MTRKEFMDKYLDMANDIRDERTKAEIALDTAEREGEALAVFALLNTIEGKLAIVLQIIEDIKGLE